MSTQNVHTVIHEVLVFTFIFLRPRLRCFRTPLEMLRNHKCCGVKLLGKCRMRHSSPLCYRNIRQKTQNVPARGGLCECRLQGMLTINWCSGIGRIPSDLLSYKSEKKRNKRMNAMQCDATLLQSYFRWEITHRMFIHKLQGISREVKCCSDITSKMTVYEIIESLDKTWLTTAMQNHWEQTM